MEFQKTVSFNPKFLFSSLKYFLFSMFLISVNLAWAQSQDTSVVDTPAYEAPVFPGGEEAFFEYIEKELYLSLNRLIVINLQGDNFGIKFKVDKFGKAVDVDVFSSSNLAVNRFLVGVFVNMPLWEPGKLKGEKATLQMEYRIIIQPDIDGYGYVVTKNNYYYKKDNSTKTLKTVLLLVSVGVMALLLATSKP